MACRSGGPAVAMRALKWSMWPGMARTVGGVPGHDRSPVVGYEAFAAEVRIPSI